MWVDEVTKGIADCYGRLSAQRLTRDLVEQLLSQVEPGQYLALGQVVEAHKAFQPRFRGRESEYKESMLWVFKDLRNCTDGIFEYTYSDFLERLFEEEGLVIIEAGTLPSEHYQFLISYIMHWLYTWRLNTAHAYTA